MTLKDFFTLTEMKDGLTACARVKELVNIMKEERDSAFANTSEATRHWYTVASTIAATEDKDCLDLFVQLDGILFINKWLEDAQKLGNEESIVELLNAVEKLSLSYEKSVTYGTREIVEKLFSHSSGMVQEKAKAVFGRWKQKDDGEAIKGETMPSEGRIDPNIGVVVNEEIQVKIDNDKVGDIENSTKDEEKALDRENKKDKEKALDHENMKDEGPGFKRPSEEGISKEDEQSPCNLEGNPSNSTSTATVPKEDGIVSNQFSGDDEQMQEVTIPSEILVATEVSPSPMEKDSEPVMGSNIQTGSENNVENSLTETTTDDMRAEIPLSSNDNNAINVVTTPPNHSETMELSPKRDTPHTSSSSDTTNTDHSTSESGGEAIDTSFLKNKAKDNNHVANNKNMSVFELNYGMVDALEVARQVAIEVEREVEGRRETSCSTSSQKVPETQPTQPSSPVSVHGDEMETEQNDQNNLTIEPDKETFDFDLNEEICCSDNTDQALDTTSTYVSIVSASRAAAAPGLPVTPLQFEGAHGWKGTAATSAFRPASPRKTHDIDTIDTNSKRDRSFLDFDLNMSEEGDDKATDLPLPKKVIYSGESSGEARVILDLNRVSDEGDAPLSRFSERMLLGRSNHRNASPSSSSSSMRNFDLNDQPAFVNDRPELNFFANSLPSQSLGSRSNGNVISIMGTKVEVDRKHAFPPQPPFLPNGRAFEPSVDVNFTRSGGILGIPYPVPGMFTYNGLTNGPSGPVMYGPSGPIPYMVDLRGAPMPYSQPPFTNIYGMQPPGFNGPGPGHGPLRPSFDLNLGLNRESGVLRQFLGPGQSFQPSSSGNIGKRKEPDGAWEPYPFDYKHHQWK